jgi:hypothetical protein
MRTAEGRIVELVLPQIPRLSFFTIKKGQQIRRGTE